MSATITTPAEINRFWLEETGPDGWYKASDALDQTIRDRFLTSWEQAEALVPGWIDTPDGALAALILTDQFPRNRKSGAIPALRNGRAGTSHRRSGHRFRFDLQYRFAGPPVLLPALRAQRKT